MTQSDLGLVESESPGSADRLPPLDTGIACFVMVARLLGIAADPDQIKHQFGTSGQPLSPTDWYFSRSRGSTVRPVVRL